MMDFGALPFRLLVKTSDESVSELEELAGRIRSAASDASNRILEIAIRALG